MDDLRICAKPNLGVKIHTMNASPTIVKIKAFRSKVPKGKTGSFPLSCKLWNVAHSFWLFSSTVLDDPFHKKNCIISHLKPVISTQCKDLSWRIFLPLLSLSRRPCFLAPAWPNILCNISFLFSLDKCKLCGDMTQKGENNCPKQLRLTAKKLAIASFPDF